MIFRILKKNTKEGAQRKAFFSGFGSIINMSPALPTPTYKGQGQDLAMLTGDMRKIGSDFQAAIAKVSNEPRR